MSRRVMALMLLCCLLPGAVGPATAQLPLRPVIGPVNPALAQQPTAPTNKAEWISFLTKTDQMDGATYQKLMALSRIDPEEAYSILKESWKDIHFWNLRMDLLQRFGRDGSGTEVRFPVTDSKAYENEKVRPHLLDMIDLGANDSSTQVQHLAYSLAGEIAMKPIADASGYQAWRKEIQDIPLAEIVRANCRKKFTEFAQADNAHKAALLDEIGTISFSTGSFSASTDNKTISGVIAMGLTGVRRNTALACGLPDALARCLQEGTPPALTQHALLILMHFMPDPDFYTRYDSDLRRVLTAMTSKKDPQNGWFVISSLAQIKSPWVTDLLLKLIVEDYPDEYFQTALQALTNRKDPRGIPTLLALLDSGVDENLMWQIYHGLAQFDPGSSNGIDADRWLDWWEQNKGKFPPEVRDLPFPTFKAMANGIAIPRRNKRLKVDNDPQRAYWLISPGILLSGSSSVTLPASTHGTATIAAKDRPGLMVVLCDGDMNDLNQRKFWSDAATKAFDGKYLIALVIPPKWSATQKAAWITSNNRNQVKEATFTTETLVADVVADIVKRYPINPEHVFLHGEGEAGLAVYACSLQPQTPFRGFYLLASPFRSLELPPLAHAKGRHYFLQHSQSDKTVPYFLASAAGQLLTKAGAIIKLETYQGEHGYHFTGDAWEPMAQALKWLEGAK